MPTTDQFATYNKLLALSQQSKTKGDLRAAINAAGIKPVEDEPFSGYWRCAAVKGGPLLPVAIWRDEKGVLQIWRANNVVAKERVWPHCIWSPIPFDWYEAVSERGEPWPDAAEVTVEETKTEDKPAATAPVTAPAAAPPVTPTEAPVTLATAELPPQTPEEIEAAKLEKKIKAAIEAAKEFAEIKDADHANKAQASRSELTKMAGQGNKTREALNRPLINKQREINDRWNPIIKDGKAASETIRLSLAAFAKKLEAEAAAEAAKAAPPAPEPEQQQDEGPGETQPFIGEQIGGNYPDDKLADVAAFEQAPPQEAEKPAPIAFKGASGRAAQTYTKKTAIVTDIDKLFQYIKAFPEIKEAMRKVAQRLVDNDNKDIPGVEINEETDVK